MEKVQIQTEYIKLDQFLKWVGAADMGSDAKMMILEGIVKVNGEVCTMRGKKLKKEDIIEIIGESTQVFQIV